MPECTIGYYQYLDIVLAQTCALKQARKWRASQQLPIPQHLYGELAHHTRTLLNAPWIIVVFTAMFLEAFINDFARRNSTATYAKNFIYRSDFMAKWVLVPRVFSKPEITQGSEAFGFLSKLNSLRNEMVHYKSHSTEQESSESNTDEYARATDFALKCPDGILHVMRELAEGPKGDSEAQQFIDYIQQQMKCWDGGSDAC